MSEVDYRTILLLLHTIFTKHMRLGCSCGVAKCHRQPTFIGNEWELVGVNEWSLVRLSRGGNFTSLTRAD